MTLFTAGRFNPLGGVSALSQFEQREEVFKALRQSILVRQASLTVRNGVRAQGGL